MEGVRVERVCGRRVIYVCYTEGGVMGVCVCVCV